MNKKADRKVPEVRFKGFTDDWEQRKFCNAVDRISKQSSDPELPHIEYENIESDLGKLNTALVKLHSNKKGIIFRKNDILFGKLRPYLKNWYLAEFKGIAVGDFWVLRSDKYLFIYYLIQTSRFFSISNISTGSKMPRSDWNLVSNCMFFIPNDAEAKVIGKTIQLVDYLIDLQQKKLEQLSQLKNSLLSNLMMTAVNAPKLSPEISGKRWVKVSLADLLVQEFKGTTKLEDTEPGQTEYLDVERLNGNDPVLIDKPIDTQKNDIVILWDGSKAGKVYYGFQGSLGSTLKVLRINTQIADPYFIYQQIKYQQDIIYHKYRTPNIPHLVKDFTKIFPIYLPPLSLQKKESAILKKLDSIIRKQQSNFHYLTTFKKFLLQKLFI